MAKKTAATQPQAEPTIAPSGQEPQPAIDAGRIIETNSAPKLKEQADIITELHTLWDNLTANGKDAEAEFMAVINAKLSGKTHEEVKALHQQARHNESNAEERNAADAEWQQRNAEHKAKAEANLQTRIDRPKKNSTR